MSPLQARSDLGCRGDIHGARVGGDIVPAQEDPPMTAPAANLPATSREAMDAAVRDLQAHRQAWTEVSVRDRISLLEELIRSFLPVAERWAEAAIEAEGIDRSLPTSGEEALVGPYFVIRNLRLLRKALWDVE